MTDTVETQLFIDGAARPASDGGTYEIFNPARPTELVGRAAAGTPDDVEAAMKAAHRSFPAWAALSYSERADMLRKVAVAITQDMEEVEARARLFTREHGKIVFETRLEISRIGCAVELAPCHFRGKAAAGFDGWEHSCREAIGQFCTCTCNDLEPHCGNVTAGCCEYRHGVCVSDWRCTYWASIGSFCEFHRLRRCGPSCHESSR